MITVSEITSLEVIERHSESDLREFLEMRELEAFLVSPIFLLDSFILIFESPGLLTS